MPIYSLWYDTTGVKPTFYPIRDDHTNHYITNAVTISTFVTNLTRCASGCAFIRIMSNKIINLISWSQLKHAGDHYLFNYQIYNCIPDTSNAINVCSITRYVISMLMSLNVCMSCLKILLIIHSVKTVSSSQPYCVWLMK